MPTYEEQQKIEETTKEIRAQLRDKVSPEQAREMARERVMKESSFLSPEQNARMQAEQAARPMSPISTGEDVLPQSGTREEHAEIQREIDSPKQVEPSIPIDADKLVEEQEAADPNKWSKFLGKETKVEGIDALAEAAYEDATITEPAQAPEGEEGYDGAPAIEHGGEPTMPSEQEMEYYAGKDRSKELEEGQEGLMGMEEDEERIAGEIAADSAEFNKEYDAETERHKKYIAETISIIKRHDEESEERLKNPNHPGYINPKDQRHIERLQGMLDNLGSGGAISPEDSQWVQKYREELAAKQAKVQADKDSGSIRYISDDASETDTRVAGQLSAEDRAREAAGIPVKRKIYPPKTASDGRQLPMITHDPSLTRVIEVFDPPGSDNLVNRIVEDIPGAREQQGRDKQASGKVRMRQAEGGYVAAADDEPYSAQDQYMSKSQAGRAGSTAEKRIREKTRRKGLLARNRKIDKGYRDPNSPFAYGEDAAAVRIAQIAADAEKAKAEAEARIKSDDTLNAHQKQLAIIKAQGEIDAKEAAEQRGFDAEQNQEDRNVTSGVLKNKKDEEEEVKERQRRLDQIGGLETNLTSLQTELATGGGTAGDKIILRDKITKLKQQIADLRANLDKPEVEPEVEGGEPDAEGGEPGAEGGGEPVDPVDPEIPTVSLSQHQLDLEAHGDLAVGYTAELLTLVSDNDGDETLALSTHADGNNTDALNRLADKIREFLTRGRITEKMLVQIGPIILGTMDKDMLDSYRRLVRVRDGQDNRHSINPGNPHWQNNYHNQADDTVTFLEKFFAGKLPSNTANFVPKPEPVEEAPEDRRRPVDPGHGGGAIL